MTIDGQKIKKATPVWFDIEHNPIDHLSRAIGALREDVVSWRPNFFKVKPNEQNLN